MEELEIRGDLSPTMHPNSCPGQDADSALSRIALHGLYDCAGKLNDLAKTNIDREALGKAAEPAAESAVKKAGETLARLDELSVALGDKIAREIVSQAERDLEEQQHEARKDEPEEVDPFSHQKIREAAHREVMKK